MQWKHDLSDNQLTATLEALNGELGDYLRSGKEMPTKINQADKILREQAGVCAHKYHGCTQCNKHVWDENDKSSTCPLCGGRRYDTKGAPLEEVIHFPLKERLEALLRVDNYYDACLWETTRHQPKPGVVSGII